MHGNKHLFAFHTFEIMINDVFVIMHVFAIYLHLTSLSASVYCKNSALACIKLATLASCLVQLNRVEYITVKEDEVRCMVPKLLSKLPI